MAEQIKKGWLYTREDEKFAPNTLVENVYTRSGTPYDEQVRNYFEAVRRANATTEGETAAKLKEHTQRLNALDKDIENLKKEDINLDSRLDVEEQTSTEHNSRLDKLETKTQYQDITSEKTFFIVDKDDNVIGYFDEFGLHAVNILSGGSTTHPQVYDLNDELADIHQTESDLNDAIAAEAKARADADLDLAADISQNEQDIAAIKDVFKHSEFDDAFYFTDSNKNVVAYVDKTGVHAVNIWFGSDTGAEAHGPIRDLISTIEALLLADSNINDMLSNHEGRIDGLDSALAQEVIDRTAGDAAINNTLTDMQNNFSWADDNKRLYIIDGTADQNVLAVFYDNGLMIPDVVIKDIKNNKEKNLRSSASYLTPEKEITITWL